MLWLGWRWRACVLIIGFVLLEHNALFVLVEPVISVLHMHGLEAGVFKDFFLLNSSIAIDVDD